MDEWTDGERVFLREILADWLSEGHETPPYAPVFYDVADKLGLLPEHVSQHDIRRSM